MTDDHDELVKAEATIGGLHSAAMLQTALIIDLKARVRNLEGEVRVLRAALEDRA